MELIPVLVDLRSVHNVASIFRTADAAGCKEIVLTGFTPSPFDRFGKVRKDFAKVALGAEKHFVIRHFKQIGSAIRALKKEGKLVVALEQSEKSIPYDSFKKKLPGENAVALLVGNEPEGLRPSVLEKADAVLEIPMRGQKESLNVAVAFGIAAYEIASD
jgi:tRNA G18 (ribose-2'-O)-methylase SpoU